MNSQDYSDTSVLGVIVWIVLFLLLLPVMWYVAPLIVLGAAIWGFLNG